MTSDVPDINGVAILVSAELVIQCVLCLGICRRESR